MLNTCGEGSVEAYSDCRDCNKFSDFVARKSEETEVDYDESNISSLIDEFRQLGGCPVACLVDYPFPEVDAKLQPTDCIGMDERRYSRKLEQEAALPLYQS